MSLILKIVFGVMLVMRGEAGAETLQLWLVGEKTENNLFVVIQDDGKTLLYSVDTSNVQESASAIALEDDKLIIDDLNKAKDMNDGEKAVISYRRMLLAIDGGDYSKANYMQIKMILKFIEDGKFRDKRGEFEKSRGSIVTRIKNYMNG